MHSSPNIFRVGILNKKKQYFLKKIRFFKYSSQYWRMHSEVLF